MMNRGPQHLPPRRARVFLTAAFGVLSIAYLSLGPGAPSMIKTLPEAANGASPLTDVQLRAMVVGRWKTISNGERIVINRPDGTATMDVVFDFIPSLRYGTRMQLRLTWTVDQGVLAYTILAGDPQAMVARVIADYGDYATYTFKSIAEQRMHLVRVNDADESYVWTRVD